MKRELLTMKRHLCGCCPGHDKFPGETYSSNRSKRARSRDKKTEHQYVRTLVKREINDEVNNSYEPN